MNNLKKTLVGTTVACALSLSAGLPVGAQTLDLLNSPASLRQTGANNSLVRTKGLFRLIDRKGKRTYRTDSELVNIHSHYSGKGAAQLKNFTYSGRFRILDANGGVGVTFYSDFPRADWYYRLRQFNGGSFHIAPHGTNITSGEVDTGVTPAAGVWYKFKILTRSSRNRTTIRAKVWRAGTKEPNQWQANCEDSSDTKRRAGRPGVWSMAAGSKQWADLIVRR